MVSAMGTRESVERAQALGVRGFLVKPFREEQVLEALREALEGADVPPRRGSSLTPPEVRATVNRTD